MTALIKWLAQLWESIKTLFVATVLTIYDMLKDLVAWVLDGILTAASAAINAVNWGLLEFVNWAQVPAPIIGMIGSLELGTALGIIVNAIILKLTLKLIPFSPFK